MKNILAENMRRFGTKNLAEGIKVLQAGILPNVEYFKENPKGKLVVDDIGNVLQSVNDSIVSDDDGNNKMYSDELVRGGEYQYEFEPSVKTMRAPSGEPVVNLFQNGQLVNSFMPIK